MDGGRGFDRVVVVPQTGRAMRNDSPWRRAPPSGALRVMGYYAYKLGIKKE